MLIRQTLAVLLLTLSPALAFAQVPLPGEEQPADTPTLEFTETPTANNIQKVTAKISWTNSIGITKVRVELFKKGNGNNFDVSIGFKEIDTTQVNGNSISTLFPDPFQPANTKIKVVITSFNGAGGVIKSKTSSEVNLP